MRRAHPKRALWITGESTPAALQHDFNTITLVERVVVGFHNKPLSHLHDLPLRESMTKGNFRQD